MEPEDVERELLSQLSKYLNGEITKEEYANIAETFFSGYAKIIENRKFYRVFVDSVPDACLFYVDEPGLTEEKKENLFREQLTNAYLELISL